MSPAPGRLIALEGAEAAGKSTQAALLATAIGALVTREPGGTRLGEEIRAMLLDPGRDPPDPRAEALLLAADRAHHVASVVRPALASGRWVVTDRYAGSFLAYQGYGRGLDLDELRWLSSWASVGLWPDLTVLLELPEPLGAARAGGPPDRLEGEGAGFHARVAAGYRSLAQSGARRWVVVDATGSRQEVAARVLEAVSARLGPLPSPGNHRA